MKKLLKKLFLLALVASNVLLLTACRNEAEADYSNQPAVVDVAPESSPWRDFIVEYEAWIISYLELEAQIANDPTTRICCWK